MKRVLLDKWDSFVIREIEDAETCGDKDAVAIGSVSPGSFFHVTKL